MRMALNVRLYHFRSRVASVTKTLQSGIMENDRAMANNKQHALFCNMGKCKIHTICIKKSSTQHMWAACIETYDIFLCLCCIFFCVSSSNNVCFWAPCNLIGFSEHLIRGTWSHFLKSFTHSHRGLLIFSSLIWGF